MKTNAYITSRDYERLYHLLFNEKLDVYGSYWTWGKQEMETYRNDPYFRKYGMFRCNKYGNPVGLFENVDRERFMAICESHVVEFIDPASQDAARALQIQAEANQQLLNRIAEMQLLLK